MSPATARTWSTMISRRDRVDRVDAAVFWAVIAMIAVVPWTPQRANALRSAWIPAPPPESEPAIVSATGTRPRTRRDLDRGLRLRRRRRDPGGPEGVRALRRARDDSDHRDHRAEHASASLGPRGAAEMIVDQVSAVADDIGVDAVKIGMLGDERDDRRRGRGARGRLAGGPGRRRPGDGRRERRGPARRGAPSAALIERLLPLATVATPNLPEARELSRARRRRRRPEELARAVHALGPRGGDRHRRPHRGGRRPASSTATTPRADRGPRHPDGASHGSGCTHSSALAAHLARGVDVAEAARAARAIAAEAVATACATSEPARARSTFSDRRPAES